LTMSLLTSPARAQEQTLEQSQAAPGGDAPIVIPGNAEHALPAHGTPHWAVAALQRQPANAAAATAATTDKPAGANAPIVIPGTRETSALKPPFASRGPVVEHPGMPTLPTITPRRTLGSAVHVSAGQVTQVVVQSEQSEQSEQARPATPATVDIVPRATRPAITPISVPARPAVTIAPHAQAIAVNIPAAVAPRPATSNTVGDAIRATAEQFLRQQTVGLPGQIGIAVNPVSPRGLAVCTGLEAFLPPGTRLWGRTMVGVRCLGEHPWTLYVQAHISVHATYYVAARDIAPGQTIEQPDLVARDGDLANLPRSVVTDPAQAVGALAQNRITAGLPLRQDMIRAPLAIQLGQTVRLVASGEGFSISTDGSAMQNAATGQPIRVKTRSGQIVSGIVKADNTVQIPL
jgi:flagella basal body P-ring formation protein FlgA